MDTMDKGPNDFSHSIQSGIPAHSMNQDIFNLFPGNSQDLLNNVFDPTSVDMQGFNLMGSSYLDTLFDSTLGPGNTSNLMPMNELTQMGASTLSASLGNAGEYDLDLPGYVLDDL